ncbi:Squamosa promoter-binding-like protein 12 [Apostasia shenzhenica]|uniref:Squamosa promoter-binding-like protein 12 n=1 Tax=Apostasia shenzhenica TaxID=1088818 RepID=A0A2H9ZXZ8_9ASPA|nr:Squamosa promoter-binding-like protein 12 [Apostasia shenzhenica]
MWISVGWIHSGVMPLDFWGLSEQIRMEATNIGEAKHQSFAAGTSGSHGKNAHEWDLNEWEWNGDLFVATPVKKGPLDCRNKQLFSDPALSNSSSSYSGETEFGITGIGQGAVGKRRRIMIVEDDEQSDEAGSLTLKLGGHSYPVLGDVTAIGGTKNGIMIKVQGSKPNQPKCLVEGCCADLSHCKDYHKRHKVCEMHAKASSAVVGNVIQRFCQQCSRFHHLQEFDEEKRSCRRRLAGHNRRRRKTHSEATSSGTYMSRDQSTSYLLISFLRILANLMSDKSEQSKDHEFLSNLLRNIACLAGSAGGNSSPSIIQASQDLQKVWRSFETSNDLLDGVPMKENIKPSHARAIASCHPLVATIDFASGSITSIERNCQKNITTHSLVETGQVLPSQSLVSQENDLSRISNAPGSSQHMLPLASKHVGQIIKGFDLNIECNEDQNGYRGFDHTAHNTFMSSKSNCFPWKQHDSLHSSPLQTSGNSDSASPQSPSSSNCDAQSRTDRLVFKLFGKDPNDFPLALRAQILDWLSHSPTDIESYIRPGCIILSVYLRLDGSAWEKLCCDLGSSLKALLCLCTDDFWRTGWIYARVQQHIAFIYKGEVVFDKSLMTDRFSFCKIYSVAPIAVSPSSMVTFKVKGSNLLQSSARLLCAFEGRYLTQGIIQSSVERLGDTRRCRKLQYLSISCSLPKATGRGFIEVEDSGLSGGFFPFIVAEEDICAEVRSLESSIDVESFDDLSREKFEAKRNVILNFLHEMGWLLRRSQLRSRLESMYCFSEGFSLVRFRWLLKFGIDSNWCAVVKKLLDILFEGNIELGGRSPFEVALSENLLHRAVQKNSKSTVKLLLRYKSENDSDRNIENFIFRPDMPGPSTITPLHVVANCGCADSMLDILTDDPGRCGLKAWSSARDITGFTPNDYARARGHKSYIMLVENKIKNKIYGKHDVFLNIPRELSLASYATNGKLGEHKSCKQNNRGMENSSSILSEPSECRLCYRQSVYRSAAETSLPHRPMLRSMVGIAAVCVCVGLLFKGPPKVLFVCPPFSWERLQYGYIGDGDKTVASESRMYQKGNDNMAKGHVNSTGFLWQMLLNDPMDELTVKIDEKIF